MAHFLRKIEAYFMGSWSLLKHHQQPFLPLIGLGEGEEKGRPGSACPLQPGSHAEAGQHGSQEGGRGDGIPTGIQGGRGKLVQEPQTQGLLSGSVSYL